MALQHGSGGDVRVVRDGGVGGDGGGVADGDGPFLVGGANLPGRSLYEILEYTNVGYYSASASVF